MKVSVIVPVYNGESFLGNTLKTIQNQTFKDFECLVVDDGSSDATGNVVADFGIEDKRFKFIPLRHEGAPGHCRNEGLRKAKGEYVVYFDSDDLMEPDYLEKMLKYMDEETDLVIGNVRYYDVLKQCEVTNEMEAFFAKNEWQTVDLFSISPFPCNKLYRRSFLIDSNVWYLEGVFNQDLSYFLCLCMHYPRFKVCKDVVMQYQMRPNSITTSNRTKKKHLDILACFDQVFAEYEKLKPIDLEYGLYEMFIKTMIYKTAFFDFEKDQKELNMISDYLYQHAPNWEKRPEYLNYYSKKKRFYNALVLKYKMYKPLGVYKRLKGHE